MYQKLRTRLGQRIKTIDTKTLELMLLGVPLMLCSSIIHTFPTYTPGTSRGGISQWMSPQCSCVATWFWFFWPCLPWSLSLYSWQESGGAWQNGNPHWTGEPIPMSEQETKFFLALIRISQHDVVLILHPKMYYSLILYPKCTIHVLNHHPQ